jgi:WD40 repeat protein
VIWDIGGHQRGGGAVRGELTGHGEAVTCISFNPSVPGVLASSSGDETIKVWERENTHIYIHMDQHIWGGGCTRSLTLY